MHGCILGSDSLRPEAEFQPLLLVTSSLAQRDHPEQRLGLHPRHTSEEIVMSMQSATRRIEDWRRKIGWHSGGGGEIGSASFQVLSVAKSLSSRAPPQWLRPSNGDCVGEQSTEIVYWQANSKKEAPARLVNGPEENRPIRYRCPQCRAVCLAGRSSRSRFWDSERRRLVIFTRSWTTPRLSPRQSGHSSWASTLSTLPRFMAAASCTV